MTLPFVSIVIPCYNAGKWIYECLDSCLSQTYQNYEIICINDGSQDDTETKLAEYARKYPDKIRVWTTENHGVSAARELGTQQTLGEWIQYLDADDLLLSQSLQKKIDGVVQNPRADVIYTNWQELIEKKNDVIRGREHHEKIEDVHPISEIAIFKGFWAPTCAYLYRKSIIEKIGGWNRRLPIIQDARFALDFARHGAEFIHIPEILCLYRMGHENALSKKRKAFAEDCYRNAKEIELIWTEKDVLSESRLEALLTVYLYIARSVYFLDRDFFHLVVGEMRKLDRDFIRVAPKALRDLSRLIGYEQAEWVSIYWRKMKKIFQPGSMA